MISMSRTLPDIDSDSLSLGFAIFHCMNKECAMRKSFETWVCHCRPCRAASRS